MQTRTDFYTASPDAMKAMLALEAAVGKLSIEQPLLELVRLIHKGLTRTLSLTRTLIPASGAPLTLT